MHRHYLEHYLTVYHSSKARPIPHKMKTPCCSATALFHFVRNDPLDDSELYDLDDPELFDFTCG